MWRRAKFQRESKRRRPQSKKELGTERLSTIKFNTRYGCIKKQRPHLKSCILKYHFSHLIIEYLFATKYSIRMKLSFNNKLRRKLFQLGIEFLLNFKDTIH